MRRQYRVVSIKSTHHPAQLEAFLNGLDGELITLVSHGGRLMAVTGIGPPVRVRADSQKAVQSLDVDEEATDKA